MSEDWTRFLSEAVTPCFPEGLSVWQASGQWRSASGQIIREPSFVVSLIHPDDLVPNGAVQEIIASYKTRFQQEAVLRVTDFCLYLALTDIIYEHYCNRHDVATIMVVVCET